ncbi:acyltransferase [Microbacterium protaetiae]|uniref:Acyltransferase n=1 Tax=Microbacterium protaetiae TaxID=2509458 RepID=A0A4P6ENZ0_9MICO|nr:acyltransferase [Microbacterium protaetiae]QAY59638.1 acyltransferase [Microbacterium protaetiae]
MAIVQAPPIRDASPVRAQRDTAVDLVRALCVATVVVLHALMVGVTITPTGPVFENAAEGTAWLMPLTWVAQIMPVFFVVGGFAGAVAYRRLRGSGGTAVAFVSARIHRLLVPAVVSIGAVGIGLAMLTVFGVPGEIVQVAGFRYSQPLWFLGVFLLCQALLPALLAAHERATLRSILVLVGAAVAVDVIRAATGAAAIGFLNLAFVWLALQQLGFFLADGRIDALRRRTRTLVVATSIATLALAFVVGVFSPDLLENLNPPTAALLLVGAAQTALFSLVREPLTRFSRRPRVATFTRFVTARTMTIYLWHMPVLLTMAGLTALAAISFGMPLPEPSSTAWWITRPLWIGVAAILVAATAWSLAGFERRRMPQPTTSNRRVWQAVLLGLVAVVLLLAAGTTVITAAVAITLITCALRLAGRDRRAGASAVGR